MADLPTIVWSVVGAGGGGAAVAYGVFRALGAKWLDSRFASRLQALKHSHDQEMAHLKMRIDGQLDRAVKLNQREFEVVPTIWKAVTEAHYELLGMIAIFQSGPDLNRMSEPQFEGFLEKSRLEEWQKTEMRSMNGMDRTSYYGNTTRLIRLNDTNKAIINFNNALLTNSIFLHPSTFAKFESFGDPLRKAFNRWRVNSQMGDEYRITPEGEHDPVEEYRQSGHDIYEGLARYLREHFYGHETISTPTTIPS